MSISSLACLEDRGGIRSSGIFDIIITKKYCFIHFFIDSSTGKGARL